MKLYDAIGYNGSTVWGQWHDPKTGNSCHMTAYKNLSSFYKELKEGGLVLDSSDVLWENKLKGCSGPMLRGSLANCSIVRTNWDAWKNDDGTHRIIARSDKPLELILPYNEKDIQDSDYVSLDIYAKMKKQLGYLVGWRKNNEIVWEHGIKEEIQF